MKTVCVIPARFQSGRFPGKLLAKVQGKTVLQRTFESALRCPDLDALYVATDDERIAEHIRSLNGEVIWTSPTCKNGTERIAEAFFLHTPLQSASFIVNLQGDHPCTEPTTISAILEILKQNPSALASTAVCKLQNEEEYLSPHLVKCVFDQEYNALYFSRSPIPFGNFSHAYGHIGIYCYRSSFFLDLQKKPPTPLQLLEDLEQLKILEWGYQMKVAVVDETPLGIDTPQDLAKLEQVLCQNISL